MFDVTSDYILNVQYWTKTFFDRNVSNFNDPAVEDIDNPLSRHCTLQSNFTDDDIETIYTFTCYDWNPMFGSLTFTFIHWPATHILASVIGPIAAGGFSAAWGAVMVIVGVILLLDGIDDGTGGVLGVIMAVLGAGTMYLGQVQLGSRIEDEDVKLKDVLKKWLIFLVYPILILVSPLILFYIKLKSACKPNNLKIKKQAKSASVGESILEAAPQYCLQLYVVLTTWEASWKQWFSITTSALSLSLANLDKFLTNIGKELGPNIDTARCFLIMFLNSMFKVMSVAIFCVLYRGFIVIYVMLYYWAVWLFYPCFML